MSEKRALILGITGQDGSFLAEFLLEKDYDVHGASRRVSTPNTARINHILDSITMHFGDITDQSSVMKLIDKIRPHEVYNLAAQSFVPASWNHPITTVGINSLGVFKVLEAIRLVDKNVRFYQASSSELYGDVAETPQDENTPFRPRSPYAIAKLAAYWTTINYRQSYDMFCSNGILFNHESERRGYEFVTRKVTRAAARISLGLQDKLYLGNMDAKRDWGHAKDYVRAMWLMLQQDEPGDFVIGSGETHSVRELAQLAFECVGLDYEEYVEIDPKFLRPADVNLLHSNPSKAKKELGWEPEISFKELIRMMVTMDLDLENPINKG